MQLPPFDELKNLANQNPDALEALRQQLIEKTINSASEDLRRRLRGLQFQIDMERQRASNPLSACLRISRMMHEHLHTLVESLNTADTPEAVSGHSTMPAHLSANIIPFPLRIGS
ncbi:MAG: DUF3135 domain-containing protein [Saccharospirillaceae bacterium]|nr:DUF3135 domain-containing protein [Saccharospirillaceae bacterium]MCD8531226.1 DUF3135 domain-containing protein [Saccharospirillaceae bacterium]